MREVLELAPNAASDLKAAVLSLFKVEFLSECDFYQNPSNYFTEQIANEPELDGQCTELSCEINPEQTQQAKPDFHIDDIVYVPSLSKRGRVDAIAISGKLLLVEPDGALAGSHLGAFAPEEVQEVDEKSWETGDYVQITSDRHGAEKLNTVGKITAISSVGAAVSVNGGAAQFYHFNELTHAKKQTASVA